MEFNQITGKYECMSGYNSNGKLCEKSRDGCSCETCKAGISSLSNGKCNWNKNGLVDVAQINGCLVHSSDTVCTTCEFGYL